MNTELLKSFADNQLLFNEVKSVLRRHFEVVWDDSIGAVPDSQLGQYVRARLIGLQLVEEGFKELAKYKTLKDRPLASNPAR